MKKCSKCSVSLREERREGREEGRGGKDIFVQVHFEVFVGNLKWSKSLEGRLGDSSFPF